METAVEEFAEVVDAAREAFEAERACWRRMVALHLERWRASGRPHHVAMLVVPGRHAEALADDLAGCGYRVRLGEHETDIGGRALVCWRLDGEPRRIEGVIRFAAAASIPFEG